MKRRTFLAALALAIAGTVVGFEASEEKGVGDDVPPPRTPLGRVTDLKCM